MKKSFIIVSMTALFIMGLVACNDAPKIDEFVGKWNMTNDEESSIQKTMELKEDHSFVETWTVYNEDGEEYAGLKIEGEYEIEITEDELPDYGITISTNENFLKSLITPRGKKQK